VEIHESHLPVVDAVHVLPNWTTTLTKY
jgi:hypothetical protein